MGSCLAQEVARIDTGAVLKPAAVVATVWRWTRGKGIHGQGFAQGAGVQGD